MGDYGPPFNSFFLEMLRIRIYIENDEGNTIKTIGSTIIHAETIDHALVMTFLETVDILFENAK